MVAAGKKGYQNHPLIVLLVGEFDFNIPESPEPPPPPPPKKKKKLPKHMLDIRGELGIIFDMFGGALKQIVVSLNHKP